MKSAPRGNRFEGWWEGGTEISLCFCSAGSPKYGECTSEYRIPRKFNLRSLSRNLRNNRSRDKRDAWQCTTQVAAPTAKKRKKTLAIIFLGIFLFFNKRKDVKLQTRSAAHFANLRSPGFRKRALIFLLDDFPVPLHRQVEQTGHRASYFITTISTSNLWNAVNDRGKLGRNAK